MPWLAPVRSIFLSTILLFQWKEESNLPSMAARVMVVSWVTRLVTNDAGEATEQVLFYTPTAKRRAPYPHK